MQLGWLDKFGWLKTSRASFKILFHDDCPDLLLSDHVPLRFVVKLLSAESVQVQPPVLLMLLTY